MPETQNTSPRRFRRVALIVAGAIACTALGAVGGAYAQGAFNFQPTESATPQFGKRNNVNIPEGTCQTNPLGVTMTEAVIYNGTTDAYEAGPASFVFGPFDAACAGGTFQVRWAHQAGTESPEVVSEIPTEAPFTLTHPASAFGTEIANALGNGQLGEFHIVGAITPTTG